MAQSQCRDNLECLQCANPQGGESTLEKGPCCGIWISDLYICIGLGSRSQALAIKYWDKRACVPGHGLHSFSEPSTWISSTLVVFALGHVHHSAPPAMAAPDAIIRPYRPNETEQKLVRFTIGKAILEGLAYTNARSKFPKPSKWSHDTDSPLHSLHTPTFLGCLGGVG